MSISRSRDREFWRLLDEYAAGGGDPPADAAPVAVVPGPGALAWAWAANTTDPRGVPVATVVLRDGRCWYHPVAFEATPGADPRRLDAYFVDWDNGGRAQLVELVDRSTGVVLDARVVERFDRGVRLSWDTGGRPVKLRLTRRIGPNCVLTALWGAG